MEYFSDMKNDINGSAIVYGLMKLISNSNMNGHFIGLLPCVENMVDDKIYTTRRCSHMLIIKNCRNN